MMCPTSEENNLFRSEALEKKRISLEGDVLIRTEKWRTGAAIFLLSLLIIAVLFLLFASIPRVEKVPGWLTTSRGLVQIKAVRAGIVESLPITQGQRVRRGDTLVTIRVEQQQQNLGSTPEKASLESLYDQDRKLKAQIDAIQKKTEDEAYSQRASAKALRGELLAISSQITRQRRIAEMAKQTYESTKKLEALGAVSHRQVLSDESSWVSAERTVGSLQENWHDIAAELALTDGNVRQSSVDKELKISEIEISRSNIKQKIIDIEGSRSYSIVSPIDGVISNITTRIGYTANDQIPLITVTPIGAKIIAELFVPSRSIGFIREKQNVRIMYDAYPFQKFGGYSGYITQISSTSLLPIEIHTPIEIKEPVYVINVEIENNNISVRGNNMPLHPGMTLNADIILERRSVLEWVFEPVLSVKERS